MAEHVQLGENFGVNVIRGSDSHKDFECQRCGWCCKQVNINVSYSDILRWSKENRLDILSEISYVDHEDAKKKGFYIIKTLLDPKQPCPFLVENDRDPVERPPICSIHDTRPRACREFPRAHSEGEKEKIECPARKSFQPDATEVFKLKKEQALDFVIAEDRKEKLIRILAIAKDVLEGQKILKEFGDDPTETLKVTTMGAERTAWTEVGFLQIQEQDQPAHYLWTTTKKAEHGDFDFANTAHSSDTFNTATLYVYGQSTTAGRAISTQMWDGSDWGDHEVTLPATWGWANVDVTLTINSWVKVDGAKLFIKQANQNGQTDVDAAYLLIDYTEAAGDTYNGFLTESVTATDTWKQEAFYIGDSFLSEIVTATDTWKQEHIEYVTGSFLSESVTATDAWKQEVLYTYDSFLSESVVAADTWKEEPIHIHGSFLSESISATDMWKEEFIAAGATFASFLTENITATDAWIYAAEKIYATYLSESVNAVDNWYRYHGEYGAVSFLSETVTATDTWKQEILRLFDQRLSEGVSVADNWLQDHIEAVFATYLSEDVTISDDWKEETLKVFKEYITESITIGDDWAQEKIEYLVNSYIAEAVTITDTWWKEILRAYDRCLSEDVTVVDAWKQEHITAQIYGSFLSESVTATDNWSLEKLFCYDRRLSEAVTISDAIKQTVDVAEYASNVARIIAIIGGD